MGIFNGGNGNSRKNSYEQSILERNALLLIQEMNEAVEDGEPFYLEGNELLTLASHVNFLLGETVRLRMTVDTLSRAERVKQN